VASVGLACFVRISFACQVSQDVGSVHLQEMPGMTRWESCKMADGSGEALVQ